MFGGGNNTMTFTLLGKDKLSPAFNTAGKSADKLDKGVSKVGKAGGMAAGGLKMMGGAVGLAAVGIAAVVPKIMNTAGSLQLLENKSRTVFGNQLGMVKQWADANANAMGLTNREAVGLAAGFGDLLIPMGFTRKEAAKMATGVVGLSGALAEWSGGQKTATEVTEILQAAMLGERDGLQALGISISAAEIEAKLLAKGQQNLTGAQLQQAEATATQELIFAKSKDAQAAFANGAGTLARKQAESKARLKEVSQTLLVTATPALMGIANVTTKHVVPALVRFGNWLAGPGKFQIAGGFLEFGESATGFGTVTLKVLKWVAKGALTFMQSFLDSMVNAFGWVPNVGDKLKKAQGSFNGFRESVDKNMDGAIKTLGNWNESARKMRDTVALKANIADLESKLTTAKTKLADKALTKERRAQIQADIRDLTKKLDTARGRTQLADPALTKARIAKLQADKKDLDAKIRDAKTKLADKSLTATKRAHLTANIHRLQVLVNAAQAKINSLKGKTVGVEIKYTSGGVNLTTPSSVGRKATGGPIHGPGGPKDDKAGIYALSNNEHVWTAREVRAAGGHGAVMAMRKAVLQRGGGLATGGMPGESALVQRAIQRGYDDAVMRGITKFGKAFAKQLEGALGGGVGSGAMGAGRRGAYGGVKPWVAAVGDYIRKKYGVRDIGGVGGRPGPSDHPSGHALDFMVYRNRALGNAVAAHMHASRQQMRLTYLIWYNRIASASRGWTWRPYSHYSGASNPTLRHEDHVHASFQRNVKGYRHGGKVLMAKNGGVLWPGMFAYNETNKPEHVFNEDQLAGAGIDYNRLAKVILDAVRDVRPIEIEQNFPAQADPNAAGEAAANRLLQLLGG